MKKNTLLLGICLVSIGCIGVGAGFTDFEADFGNGCKLIQLSANEIVISVNGRISSDRCVPSKVVSCGFDQNFIIAKQQLLDEKGNPVSGKYQFWIVDAPQKKRYGPFSEKGFIAKRNELGVPDAIRMRSKNSFRP